MFENVMPKVYLPNLLRYLPFQIGYLRTRLVLMEALELSDFDLSAVVDHLLSQPSRK